LTLPAILHLESLYLNIILIEQDDIFVLSGGKSPSTAEEGIPKVKEKFNEN